MNLKLGSFQCRLSGYRRYPYILRSIMLHQLVNPKWMLINFPKMVRHTWRCCSTSNSAGNSWIFKGKCAARYMSMTKANVPRVICRESSCQNFRTGSKLSCRTLYVRTSPIYPCRSNFISITRIVISAVVLLSQSTSRYRIPCSLIANQ